MKKYNFYLWLTVLVGLFASCSQDEAAGPQTNTESNRVTFTASLPADFAQPETRALPAVPNDHKLRCILEVWDETYDNLKVRQEVCPGSTDQFINFTFELQAIGNYHAVLWADYIDAIATSSPATIAGLSDVAHFPDKYYTTDAVDKGLKAVSLKADYPYTDERDAFCINIDFEKEATALDNLSGTLIRPLTLLTIAEKDETNFGYCNTVKATYTIPTTINVCTGELSGTRNVSYNATPAGKAITIKSVPCKTLFSDYIFAPDGGGTMGEIVLEFTAKQGSSKILSKVTIPAGVPTQANRKINAGGNLIIAQDAPSNSVRMIVDMASWDGSQDNEILPPHIWDGKYPSSEAEAKEWMGEPTSAPGQTPATYTISTAKQLAGMAYYCGEDIRTETFELATDIDLAEHPWRPVGLSESGITIYGFEGTFNGHGHTIKGMNVTVNSPFGGFIALCRGTVKNLIVEGKVNPQFGNASGDLSCGGIVGGASGKNGKGNIIACEFRGTIVGSATSAKNAFSGGIAGYNEGGNITGCISWATSVTATGGSTNNYFGGIVGFFNKYTNSQSHSTIQPTAKGNRWYYNGTAPEGVQGLSGGTGTDAVPVTEGSTAFANSSEIDATALSTINSYLAGNDYIWQKAADGNLKLVKNQQP